MDSKNTSYVLPAEKRAELSIAAAMLVEPGAITKILGQGLTADMFTENKVKALYQIASTLTATKGKPPIAAEIQMYLDKRPSNVLDCAALEEIAALYTGLEDVTIFAKYIKAAYAKAQLGKICNTAMQLASDPTSTIDKPADYLKLRLNELQSLTSEKADTDGRIKQYIYDTAMDATDPDWMFEVFNVGAIPRGSITAVTGKAKAGKSNFIMLLMSTMLRPGEQMMGVKAKEKPGKILYIDTEQPHHAINSKFRRMLRTAGLDEHTPLSSLGITLLSMREASVDERRQVFRDAVTLYQPQLVIVDGIVDLLHDFNDISESSALIAELMKVSGEGATVIALLHENEGTSKMRGHLGTILLQKCDDKFSVSKKEGYFEVTHQGRDSELDKVKFKIAKGEEGSTIYVNQFQKSIDSKVEFVKNLFVEANTDVLPYVDVAAALSRRFGWTGHSTAAKYLKEMSTGDNPVLAYNEKIKALKLIAPPI